MIAETLLDESFRLDGFPLFWVLASVLGIGISLGLAVEHDIDGWSVDWDTLIPGAFLSVIAGVAAAFTIGIVDSVIQKIA